MTGGVTPRIDAHAVHAHTAAQPAKRAPATKGRSFAEVHAAALTQGTDPGSGSAAAPSPAEESAKDTKRTATRSERGERIERVKGHAYADILSGKRNGLELNISGNERDGDAFAIVRRHGRTFHVYDVDGRHQVFEVRHRSGGSSAASGS